MESLLLNITKLRARERAQQLEARAALSEALGLIPNTHKAAQSCCNSSPRTASILFASACTSHACGADIHAGKTTIHMK